MTTLDASFEQVLQIKESGTVSFSHFKWFTLVTNLEVDPSSPYKSVLVLSFAVPAYHSRGYARTAPPLSSSLGSYYGKLFTSVVFGFTEDLAPPDL
jgi:hypothetical protein